VVDGDAFRRLQLAGVEPGDHLDGADEVLRMGMGGRDGGERDERCRDVRSHLSFLLGYGKSRVGGWLEARPGDGRRAKKRFAEKMGTRTLSRACSIRRRTEQILSIDLGRGDG